MSRITLGSNIASLRGQRQLQRTSDTLGSVYERLSSGQRINGASDDAAGLSIAQALDTASRVFGQAVRNVNDGLSFLAIADGALQQLSSIVTRQMELAEQSANGVYSYEQRQALHEEANALVSEHNRIISSTEFNGIRMLDNPGELVRIQAGYGLEGSVAFSIGGLRTVVGDGTFQDAATYPTGTSGWSTLTLDLGDVDGDGALDIVTANYFDNTSSVLLGNGNGTFNPGTTYVVSADGVSPTTIALADLNNDSALDIVTSGEFNSELAVLIGNGNGTFQARQMFVGNEGWGGRSDIAFGDFDGNGALDIAIPASADDAAAILLGNGNGTFQATATYKAANNAWTQTSVTTGDINGDTDLDLVVSDADGNFNVLLGNGNGTFGSNTEYLGSPERLMSVRLGDFDGDSVLDLVTANRYDSTVGVHLGNGNATFQAATLLSADMAIFSVDISDLNGDNHLDVVAADMSVDKAWSYLGNGDGSFRPGTSFDAAISDHSRALAVGDVNGDQAPDIVVAGYAATDSAQILIANTITSDPSLMQAPINLLTQAQARTELNDLTSQLQSISEVRAGLGAIQSRLQTTLGTLAVTRENFNAAKSRIVDADIALESSRLVSSQILQQAASSVLAQANQQPALALSLLG